MAVAVTNTKIINLQAEIVETVNAATSTVANEVEAFTITPSTTGTKTMFKIYVGYSSPINFFAAITSN